MRRRSENEVSTSTAVAGRLREDRARRLDPVHDRHLEVHQHDVGRRRPADRRLPRRRSRPWRPPPCPAAPRSRWRARRGGRRGRRRGRRGSRDGTSSSTRVPAPSRELIARLPPDCRASSSTSDRPRCPSASRSLAHLGVEPATVVRDDEPRGVVVDVQLDPQRAGLGVGDHVPHGLLRDAVDERLLLAVEPLGAVDRDRHRRHRSPGAG